MKFSRILTSSQIRKLLLDECPDALHLFLPVTRHSCDQLMQYILKHSEKKCQQQFRKKTLLSKAGRTICSHSAVQIKMTMVMVIIDTLTHFSSQPGAGLFGVQVCLFIYPSSYILTSCPSFSLVRLFLLFYLSLAGCEDRYCAG